MSEINTPEFTLSVTIENAINKSSFDPKLFAECVKQMHPTLQQSFFRLIKETIIMMADPERRVDDRNRASKEICQKIVEVAESHSVPFI